MFCCALKLDPFWTNFLRRVRTSLGLQMTRKSNLSIVDYKKMISGIFRDILAKLQPLRSGVWKMEHLLGVSCFRIP